MNEVTKAMIDLLFEVKDKRDRVSIINSALSETRYRDFSTFIKPMERSTEKAVLYALDSYFKELTGHVILASLTLCEELFNWNGVSYNLKDRADFERLIADSTKEILSINNGETP